MSDVTGTSGRLDRYRSSVPFQGVWGEGDLCLYGTDRYRSGAPSNALSAEPTGSAGTPLRVPTEPVSVGAAGE